MCGFVGVLAGLPAVMVCRWPRALLMLSGLFNVLPIVLRYTGALHRSWKLVATSNFLVNAAFGVIGAWPPMLASSQWPEAQRGAVISVASLSNAVGGALGTLAMPRLAGTASDLLEVLRLQVHVAALLGAMLGCWLWIPPLHMPRTSSPVAELRLLSRRTGGFAALLDLAASCLLVGVSLLLAGTNQFWLSSLGLSDTDSGVANTVYQVAGVGVGVGLGGLAGGERAVRQVLRALHAVLTLAIAGAAALCTQLQTDPTGARLPDGAGPAVLVLMGLFGGSLMGMLPFLMQQAESALSPLPENMVSGMLYFGALLITAALTRVCTSIAPLSSFRLIGEGRRCASARRSHTRLLTQRAPPWQVASSRSSCSTSASFGGEDVRSQLRRPRAPFGVQKWNCTTTSGGEETREAGVAVFSPRVICSVPRVMYKPEFCANLSGLTSPKDLIDTVTRQPIRNIIALSFVTCSPRR